MNTSNFILILWGITLIIAIATIGWSVYAGFRQYYSLVFWRTAKFYASVLGIIGLSFLLLNIEKTIRDSLGAKAKELALIDFYETKFFTTQFVSIICSHENESRQAQLDCFDARNTDNLVSTYNIENHKPYLKMEFPNKQARSKQIDNFFEEVNIRLSNINTLIPETGNAASFFSDEHRIKFLHLAAILLSLSIAGSVGESAYQLKQAQAGSAKPTR